MRPKPEVRSAVPRLALYALLALLLGVPVRAAVAVEDAFLAGYASAVLEQRFGIRDVDVEVRNGVLRLDPGIFPEPQRYDIIAALSVIEGLKLELLAPAREAPRPMPPSAGQALVVVGSAQGVLPRDNLFGEIIADPRWPRFSASLLFFSKDPELDTVFAGNFGATIPVYGWPAWGGQWQVALQAGVFSIFDLESDSFDLINSDFRVGAPLALRYGPVSAQMRIYHQSSHLGDEYLLRNRTERINLSYEALDALLSLEPFRWLRLYGGGGAIVHSDPDLDPWGVQAGIEATSRDPLLGSVLFPIAAFDYQASEEADWEGDYSLRAGFEIRTEFLEERRLQWLFEYFNGSSPIGQFFERDLEYFGTGLHFFF